MSNLKFERLWTLLSDYKIKIKTIDNPNLLCVICENILIDSQVALCGCRYCRKCITRYLENGEQFCPGNKEECRWEDLCGTGNMSTDHITNRKVSMLIGTCPEEMCIYECELRNMAEHIRVCENKKSTCPFYELGCKLKEIPENQMIDHLHKDNEIHSKLIVDLINNLSNEMKRIEEAQTKRTDSLKMELKKKDEKIESIYELFNNKLEELKKQIQDDRLAKINMIKKLQEENGSLKTELKNLKSVTDNLTVEVKIGSMKLFSEAGLIVWKIDKLSDKKIKKAVISSDYFYSTEGHKLLLYFYPCGCGKEIPDHLSIKLCMSNYQCNETTSFTSDVLIEILNQVTGDPIHIIKESRIQIKKGHSSTPFHLVYSFLSPDILKNNSIIFKCILIA